PASGEKDKKKGNGPGTGGGGPADQAAEALDGETPADFLARNGLAPEAWRALGDALSSVSDGVELQAGVAVDFSSSLTVGVGVGVSAGFQAGLDVSVDAALGLAADVSGGADADLDAGFALAAAGGVTAAAETAASTDAQVAADSTRESFGMATGGGGSATTPAPSGAARSPVATTPSARTGASGSGPAAPLPPRADKRATTYGRGVPLRDRVTAPDGRSGDGGYVVVGATARGDLVPVGHDRRSAPWESLSPSPTRDAADREQHRRTPSCGCHRCDPRGRQAYRS
ncbi:MAG: hypothetical protein OEU32_12130, partial [Acidimicrobiia bacterium]|nr:hypothetical protein [Acidimicrobiia bacterium]